MIKRFIELHYGKGASNPVMKNKWRKDYGLDYLGG
jgi:hypothetical protein